ncbi:MAG: hypothetical protein GY793_04950 [Proteobacteria bacterium]|nr:hypothetical protein [Pseudomonadota bacterium]
MVEKTYKNRRTEQLKPRKFGEKRASMMIITKANQLDLYVWCITITTGVGIILTFLTIAILQK